MAASSKHGGVFRIWLLNLAGNAGLMAAAYSWLLIPDAHGWQVAGSIVLLAVIIFLLAWLRAGTLAYFRLAEFRENATVWLAYRRGLRHVLSLALWAAVFALIAWILWSLRNYTPQAGVWIRQKMGAGGASPRNVTRALNWLIVLLVFVIMPALWLPVAMTISAVGLQSARIQRSLRVAQHLGYWFWVSVLIVAGVYLPYRLVWWIPDLAGIRKQAWSVGLRFSAAYLLGIAVFIVLVWMVGMRVEGEDPGSNESAL